MITTFATGIDGRVFTVALIRKGERHGRNGAVIHDEIDPLVRFFDLKHVMPQGADFRDTLTGDLGQFTGGSYYLSTLLEGGPRAVDLNLYGGEPAWTVTAQSLQQALDYFVIFLLANGYRIEESTTQTNWMGDPEITITND